MSWLDKKAGRDFWHPISCATLIKKSRLKMLSVTSLHVGSFGLWRRKAREKLTEQMSHSFDDSTDVHYEDIYRMSYD